MEQPPKLILIGGCSGTGKSTFGMSVALDQGILKCISTDTLRSVMRSFIPKEISPALHRSSYEPATTTKPTITTNDNPNNDKTMMRMEEDEDDPIKSWKETCTVLQKSIEELVEEMIQRGASIVIEGVHLIPSNELIERWEASGGIATGIVLQVPDEQAHKTLLLRRGRTTGKGEDDKLSKFHRIRAIHDEMVRLGQDAGWLVIEQHLHPDPLDLVSSRLWKTENEDGSWNGSEISFTTESQSEEFFWNPEKEMGKESKSSTKAHDDNKHDKNNRDSTNTEGTPNNHHNRVYKRIST